MGAHYTTALIIASALLIPLGWKWNIRMRIVIPSAIIIGLASGLLTHLLILLIPDLKLAWGIVAQIMFTLFLAISGILFQFYRDPERKPPDDDGVILSPADGEILYVKKIGSDEALKSDKRGDEIPFGIDVRRKYFPGPVYIIGIAMNFLDVHVNRAPIEGRIEFMQHREGKFLSLRKKESYFENERNIIIMKGESFRIGVVQIASRLVRRIISYINIDDQVQLGQRIGVITFGSQVDIVIPAVESLAIEITSKQKVKAGLSAIARYQCHDKNRK